MNLLIELSKKAVHKKRKKSGISEKKYIFNFMRSIIFMQRNEY